MKCPNDNATLQMTTREGIEIDYCPECRGVWLDRGELDKLIERSANAPYGAAPQSQHRRDDDDRHYDNHHYEERRHHDDDHHYNHHKKHKKESFLGDMFDF